MNPEAGQRVDQLSLLQKLFSIGWENGAFSDVKISAFGQQYNAHRILLCQSPFFERLLRGHWSDSQSNTLELSFDDPHICPDTFLKALQFLYGRQVNLDEDNVQGTLAVGCFLGLEPLCNRCLEFIADHLSLKTFERFYFFCSRFDYGVYSGKVRELCLDFLRMHACWEARAIVKDLSPTDIRSLLCDDVLWVPTEVERFLMLQDAFTEGEHDSVSPLDSPRSAGIAVDNDTGESSESTAAFRGILSQIRFEHFPELTLKHLMNEDHSSNINEAIQFGSHIQSQFRQLLGGSPNSLSYKFTRPFRSQSKSSQALKPKDIVNRSFRIGIELDDLSDVFKTKGLGSCEYCYAGSLWRVHIVQRRQSQRSEDYVGVFIHRRPASSTVGSWSDQRTVVEASLHVRMGWGTYKVDKTCHGKFEPDSWNSFGWPQFIKGSNLEKCKQPDGALRLALAITLTL